MGNKENQSKSTARSERRTKGGKHRGTQPGDKPVTRVKTKKLVSSGGFIDMPLDGKVNATQCQIKKAAAKKRLLTTQRNEAQKALTDAAIWDDEDTLAQAQAYMSYLFFNRAEDAAHSAKLDANTRELVQIVFVRYCRKSHVSGVPGQKAAWYTTVLTKKKPRHESETRLIEATVEKARSLVSWTGLDEFKKKVVGLIFDAYLTVESSYNCSLTESAFDKAKMHLTEEELGRTKQLQIAYNVAQAKLQQACNEVRAAA